MNATKETNMNELHTMDKDDVMMAFETYEAEAAADLLMDREEWMNMIDSMLCDMYDRDVAFMEYEGF